MSISDRDNNAACIAFDIEFGIEFPTISGIEGGGAAIDNAYGINASPTYILIAPDRTIVERDMWPISNTQTFVNYFESNGLEQAECGSIEANFSSDITEMCGDGTVQFSDMSSGDITSWEWTFEGGDPETSTEQNPSVEYSTSGSWDVTLTVNGEGDATYSIENYIEVFETPEVSMETLDGACIFWVPYELTGGMPEGGEYSGPGVTDGMFDPEAAGVGTHTITYTYLSDDGCENSTEETLEVDECTGVDEIKESEVQVYPNPAKDFVTISSKSNMVSVSISSYTGQLIEHIVINEKSYQVNTTSYLSGVYAILIKTEEHTISKLLIIK